MQKKFPALVFASFGLCLSPLFSQEAARPSIARQREETNSAPTYYNIKTGPVTFRFGTTLRTEFVDNVNLSNQSGGSNADMLVVPEFDIDAAWQITRSNVLRLTTSLGYTKYLNHSNLDSQNLAISPDSQLSFNVYTGNFKINFHDQFSYQQDPINQGALSNVSRFGRFTNIIGTSVLWDLNKAIVSLGYDHTDFITTGVQTTGNTTARDIGALDYHEEQVSAYVLFSVASTLRAGLEGVAAFRSYPQASEENSTTTSVGPFAEWQFTHYTKVYVSGGVQNISRASQTISTASQTSVLNPVTGAITQGVSVQNQNVSGDSNSYYANLGLTHQLNRYYSDRLTIGRQTQVGILAERTELTYANYQSTWMLSPRMNLSTTLFFEDAKESGGLGLTSSYDRFGLTLDLAYQLSKHMTASFFYQFTDKTAADSTQDYRQNRIGFTIGYQF